MHRRLIHLHLQFIFAIHFALFSDSLIILTNSLKQAIWCSVWKHKFQLANLWGHPLTGPAPIWSFTVTATKTQQNTVSRPLRSLASDLRRFLCGMTWPLFMWTQQLIDQLPTWILFAKFPSFPGVLRNEMPLSILGVVRFRFRTAFYFVNQYLEFFPHNAGKSSKSPQTKWEISSSKTKRRVFYVRWEWRHDRFFRRLDA